MTDIDKLLKDAQDSIESVTVPNDVITIVEFMYAVLNDWELAKKDLQVRTHTAAFEAGRLAGVAEGRDVRTALLEVRSCVDLDDEILGIVDEALGED